MDGTVVAGAGVPSRDFAAAKREVRLAVEAFLADVFEKLPRSEVASAARYAVLGGGHRWRALIAVASGNIFRHDALPLVLPAACGVELAHAASMVLDDLPSMDDAKIRRGRACAHLAFPAWAADMAPVFMVTLAYQISLDNPHVLPAARIEAALELGAAGLNMIEGQVHDMRQDLDADACEEERLLRCYRLKSAALYGAAAKVGGVLTGAGKDDALHLRSAGIELGLAYQFLDDVADVEAGIEGVGKERGMDACKLTAVDLFGVDGARVRARAFQDRSLACIERFGREADWLRRLVTEASWKSN
jgi:geranylgeranyl pyrophosphate synthase